jgi:quercetin dioxygenase-like cupin family protein
LASHPSFSNDCKSKKLNETSTIKVSKGPDSSFSVRRDLVPHVNNKWHYHSEVELIHFKKGEGTQFIGDSIKHFKAGDVVIVGANLPHYWRFDDAYFEEHPQGHRLISACRISRAFLGRQFLAPP